MQIEDFKNRHPGARACVIGKGPSLDTIDELRDYLERSVVFTCNEAVHKIELLDLRAPVYAVQQDSALGRKCVPLQAVHFMNCYQLVRANRKQKLRRVAKSEWNPLAVLYDPCSFGQSHTAFTAIMAAALARYMGCTELVFLCFDSWAPHGATHYARCVGGPPDEGLRHAVDGKAIRAEVKRMGFESVTARHPKVEV